MSEVAAKFGASVPNETYEPDEAYADCRASTGRCVFPGCSIAAESVMNDTRLAWADGSQEGRKAV
jgi:hypothetical protein